MEPLLRGGRKTLELKLNVREKKNFGGFDSVGRVCGTKCYTRAVQELKALDPAEGGPTFAELAEVGKLKVDAIEVEEEWWTEGAEDSESVTQRLNEFLHQVEHSPAKTIVVVGHSHFYRELFRRFLHPAFFQHDPQLARTLQTKSVPNCSVLCCDLDFTMRPCKCCRAMPCPATPRPATPRPTTPPPGARHRRAPPATPHHATAGPVPIPVYAAAAASMRAAARSSSRSRLRQPPGLPVGWDRRCHQPRQRNVFCADRSRQDETRQRRRPCCARPAWQVQGERIAASHRRGARIRRDAAQWPWQWSHGILR